VAANQLQCIGWPLVLTILGYGREDGKEEIVLQSPPFPLQAFSNFVLLIEPSHFTPTHPRPDMSSS
jgi:hypothetical protein